MPELAKCSQLKHEDLRSDFHSPNKSHIQMLEDVPANPETKGRDKSVPRLLSSTRFSQSPCLKN